jgi:hypothetical protein
MQKIAALIFLVTFFATQYGKLVSYWECKITNSSDISAVQCDCEKILNNTNEDDSNIMNRLHVNEKSEESFSFYTCQVSEFDFVDSRIIPVTSSAHPSAGFKGYVFHPPQAG